MTTKSAEGEAAVSERAASEIRALRAQVSELLPEADACQHFATRAMRAEERLATVEAERDRLRREIKALRCGVDDRMSDLEESGMTADRSEWHDSRSGDAMAHAELDAVKDDLDAILRGES